MHERRLTILLPDLFGGGAERCASELMMGLDERVAIDLVLFEDKHEYPYRDALHVLSEKGMRELGAADVLVHLLVLGTRFARFRREHRADTVLSMMPWASFINIVTRAGDRVVVSARTPESIGNPGAFGAVNRAMIRLLYGRADAIVAVSRGVAADLEEHFGLDPARIVTIHNPVPGERLRAEGGEPIDPDLEAAFEHPVVLCVGRLNPEKGCWPLIRAFAASLESVPGTKLVFLGRGLDAGELLVRTRALGLRAWSAFEAAHEHVPEACDVIFAGFRERPARFVARSTVYAMPSRWEGIAMALCEAIAVGAVALSSDCRFGPREILAPDTDWRRETRAIDRAAHGILLPVPAAGMVDAAAPLDAMERAWREALVEVLTDPALRREYRARAFAGSEAFSPARILPQWEAVLFPDRPPTRP